MSFQWVPLANFTLATDWLITEPVTTTVFRLRHNLSISNRYQVVAMVALATISRDGIEIFSPQKISPKLELEIIQFPNPPIGWSHSLAVKQIVLPNQGLIQWSLSIDMSLYPINPPDSVNPVASSTYTNSTATVNTTASKILAANSGRKDFMIYNPDLKNTVYLDVSASLTVATATIAIPPGSNYFADFDWIGDVYAIVKIGSVTVQIRDT